jgi:4-aminobutyrate aminotransferase/(S)-3-amino-2-methylpropionate transaminase
MPFGDTAGPEKLKEVFVKHVNPEAVACVVAEPVQGEGGFITPPAGYFQELARICRDNGIVFVADEIQSGMGRTGKMFAIEHWPGVEPDLVTVAKSMGAGMPIAAVVGRQEIMDAVHPWGLGGTYGANPVASAAALAVLEVFETEDMLGKAQALGRKLQARFEAWVQKYPVVGSIRGLGAMLGLELVKGERRDPAADEAKKLAAFCLERGLIILVCGTYGNVIRVLAPFVITDAELEKGLGVLEQGLAEISK